MADFLCVHWTESRGARQFGLPFLLGKLLPQPRKPTLQVLIVLPGRAFRGLRCCRYLPWHLLRAQACLCLPDPGSDVSEPLEGTDLIPLHLISQAVRVLEGLLEHLLPLCDQPLQEGGEGVVRNPEAIDDGRCCVDIVAVGSAHANSEVLAETGDLLCRQGSELFFQGIGLRILAPLGSFP